jgi:hypothetical protein
MATNTATIDLWATRSAKRAFRKFEQVVRTDLRSAIENKIGREDQLVSYGSVVAFSLPSLWRALDFVAVAMHQGPASLYVALGCLGFVLLVNPCVALPHKAPS